MPMSSLTLLVSVSIQPLDYYAYTAENSLSRVVPCVVLVPSDLIAYTLILSLSLSFSITHSPDNCSAAFTRRRCRRGVLTRQNLSLATKLQARFAWRKAKPKAWLLGVRQGEKGVCKCVMVVRLVLIASRGGNVLMERWAHRDSATALIPRDSPLHQHQRRGGGGNIDDDETVTLQRGEALSWLHGAAAELLTGTETKDEEQIVMRRNGVPIVFVPIGDVIFYYVGSDDVDEMQCTFGS